MLIQTCALQLFADYFQFYLLDDNDGLISAAKIWTREGSERKLAAGPGIIAIGTARNMNVPVIIKVQSDESLEEFEKWDKVNECSLTVNSGKIVVMGATDYYDDAARINVQPGTYRVRIHYGSLESISENGLDGDDHYELILWPDAEERPIKVLKYTLLKVVFRIL